MEKRERERDGIGWIRAPLTWFLVKNTSLAHIRCPLSATWPPFSSRVERAYSWVFTRTCNQPLTLKVSRGQKGCPLNPRHPSPKLPPSVLDSFMTCVRKVNNQHPFRRTIVSSRASRAFEILEKFCVLNMDFVDFELHFSIESSVAIINSGKY